MSPFRDDLHAAHERIRRLEQDLSSSRADDSADAARIATLEAEVAAAREAIERLEREGPRPVGIALLGWMRRRWKWLVSSAVLVAIVGSCLAFARHNRKYPNCAVLSSSQSDRRDLYAHETLCYCNDPSQWSCHVAAGMYMRGQETKKNEVRALELYRRACTYGWGGSCGMLADLDKPAAIEWLKKGCKLDDFDSCNELGVHLRATREILEARRLFAKACDYTVVNKTACRNLGISLRDDDPKDAAAARAAFERACKLGHAASCADLGYELEATAPADAAAHYQFACDAGNAWACWKLGRMHDDGRGVVHSKELADELFRRACDGGEQAACGR